MRTEHRSESGASRLSGVALATALYVLPFVSGATGAGAVVGWLGGLGVLGARLARSQASWSTASLAGLAAAGIGAVWFRATAYHAGMVALSLTGVLLVHRIDRLGQRRAIRLAVGASLLALVWSATHDPGGYLDVGLMHRAGADAIRSGLSPWVGLDVPSGAPGTDGTVISGDPYPPVALMWYTIGDWLTSDPRAGGAFAWLILASAALALRVADVRPVILVLTSGSLPILLWTGWTEMLTVALVFFAAALWHRPVAASVVLGLALASKQYMVALAPLVLGSRGAPRRIRRLVPMVTAALLAASGFLFGSGYLNAIIGVYGEFEARPDSASIFGFLATFGLRTSLPFWVGPIVAMFVALALVVRRPPDGPASFLRRSAEVLSVLFLLGTQAFANYWFLVWVVVLLGLALDADQQSEEGDGPSETVHLRGPT